MATVRPAGPVPPRVRMYDVGLGDCLLVTVPGPDRDHHVLVDCGVHPQGDAGTMGAVVDDLAAVTGKRLDLVLATHAHQDHVSGFGSHASRFATFDVGEVWMPWTEDPSDPVATALRERRELLVARLSSHFASLGGARFAGVRAVLRALSPNRAAFELLRSGFRGARVRYLAAGAELLGPAGIPGLSARILGPSNDPAFLARLDPAAGRRYLRDEGGTTHLSDAVRPFARHWTSKPGDPGPTASAADRRTLAARAEDPVASLAHALDRALHDTSLVALLQVGGRTLLFPGDARLASWPAGPVDLYKASQHGSAAGTPRSALDRPDPDRLAVLVSTRPRPWPGIPDPGLLELLGKRAGRGAVRSDVRPARTRRSGRGPARGTLPPGFTRGKFWVDYELPGAP